MLLTKPGLSTTLRRFFAFRRHFECNEDFSPTDESDPTFSIGPRGAGWGVGFGFVSVSAGPTLSTEMNVVTVNVSCHSEVAGTNRHYGQPEHEQDRKH